MIIRAIYLRESVNFNGEEPTYLSKEKCNMTLESGFVICRSARMCIAVPLGNVRNIALDPSDPMCKIPEPKATEAKKAVA